MLRAALVALLFVAPSKAAASENNKALAVEVFRALESGDVAVLNRIFVDDGRNHVGGSTRVRGGPHKSFAEAAPFVGALSQRKVEIFEILAEGDLVAVRSRLCGIHSEAPLLGVAPTGRQICGHYQNIYRFRAGRIIDNYVANDARDIERQVRGIVN